MSITAQIISLEDAAALIGPEDGVWVGSALSIENPLIALLSEMGESLRGLTLVGSTDSGSDDIFNPKNSGSMRIVSIHNLCQSASGDSGDGEKFCENVCRLFGINTAALRLSPPDADGCCRVDADAADLTGAVLGFEGVTRRIAMLDLSQPSAVSGDTRLKVPLKDFDYICSYKSRYAKDSIIA